MQLENKYIKTLTGEEIPLFPKNLSKDLTETELKIYKYLFKLGPKTEIEIRNNPAFHGILDIGRALRRIRSIKDPNTKRPVYIRSVKQREGPQKWEAL